MSARHKRRYPQHELDAMKAARDGGMTFQEIAKDFGRTAPAIFMTLYPEKRSQYARTLRQKKAKTK